MITYRQIPDTFKKNGWSYKLVKRDGDVAMFSQIGAGYEVVVIRRHDGRTIKTKEGDTFVEPAEYLPSDAEWGRLGWTFTQNTHDDPLGSANTRFEEQRLKNEARGAK